MGDLLDRANEQPIYDSNSLEFGRWGFKLLEVASSAADERFSVIDILTDGNMTLTADKGDSMITKALFAGNRVYGYFSVVTFTGRCLCYYAHDQVVG